MPPECVVNIKEQELKTKFWDQNLLPAKADTDKKNQKSNITVDQKHLTLVMFNIKIIFPLKSISFSYFNSAYYSYYHLPKSVKY
jgi:hypothetical protein